MKLEKKRIIYVDLDGTLCDNKELPDFSDSATDYKKAVPLKSRINIINQLFDEGHEINIWTARGALSGIDHTELTKQQLLDWGIKHTTCQVGNKPHFDMYICDKSFNSETYFHHKERQLP